MKVTFNIAAVQSLDLVGILAALIGGHNHVLDLTRRGCPDQGRLRYDAAQILRGDFTRVAAQEIARANELTQALKAWAAGEPHPSFYWEGKDETFPVDDGVTIEGPTFKVWVKNSAVTVTRQGDGGFAVEADGARHSFAANPTGLIGEILLFGGGVTDLVVESQAAMAWDMELDRLFQPTVVSEVRHAVEAVIGTSRRSARVEAAYQDLLAALADPAASAEYEPNAVRDLSAVRPAVVKRVRTREDEKFVEVRED